MARLFRLVCHTVAVAWLAALLVAVRLEAPATPETDEPEPQLAHVRPVPEPAPPTDLERPEPPAPEPVAEVEPEPAAEPELASEPTSEPEREPAPPAAIRVRSSDLARGAELLGSGDFPILSCSYEAFPSFAAYARAMASLGARFVIVRRREIVGGIDFESGELGGPRLGGGFSPRARDYTGEAGLADLARRARGQYGSGAVVMMLVPRALDAGLFGGISRMLAERGEDHGAYRELRGRYEQAGGGVRLRVDSGIRADGRRVEMNLLFDLGAIAGGVRA